MKRIILSIVLIGSLLVSTTAVLGKDTFLDQTEVLATIGDYSVTRNDVIIAQRCNEVTQSLMGTASVVDASEEDVINNLAAEKVIEQMLIEYDIELSRSEIEMIRETQEWVYEQIEYALESDNENERDMAEQTLSNMTAYAEACGETIEEYKERVIQVQIFSAKLKKLAEMKFGGDISAVKSYAMDHFEQYDVAIAE